MWNSDESGHKKSHLLDHFDFRLIFAFFFYFSLKNNDIFLVLPLVMQVMVTDNGIPQLSSTTRVVITVDDINDHTPEFDQKFYKVQIPSNAVVDQALFQVCIFKLTHCSIFISFDCSQNVCQKFRMTGMCLQHVSFTLIRLSVRKRGRAYLNPDHFVLSCFVIGFCIDSRKVVCIFHLIRINSLYLNQYYYIPRSIWFAPPSSP